MDGTTPVSKCLYHGFSVSTFNYVCKLIVTKILNSFSEAF